MDLFDYMREQNKEKESPLASRLRPTKLEEVVGQQHIIGKDKLLYRAIKADKLQSVIFYGPPGTGKTKMCIRDRNTTVRDFQELLSYVHRRFEKKKTGRHSGKLLQRAKLICLALTTAVSI